MYLIEFYNLNIGDTDWVERVHKNVLNKKYKYTSTALKSKTALSGIVLDVYTHTEGVFNSHSHWLPLDEVTVCSFPLTSAKFLPLNLYNIKYDR